MTKKAFDCVEMKHAIQAKILERENLLGPERARGEDARWLQESQDELAVFWRRTAGRIDFPVTVTR